MSAERKWTPGPWGVRYDGFDQAWHVFPHADEDPEFGEWSELACCDLYDAPNEANAHLIAASPELYDELDMQVRNCPVCKGEGVAEDILDLIGANYQQRPIEKKPCTRCSKARAVLAKARGEQP